jgi:hypothetical protein
VSGSIAAKEVVLLSGGFCCKGFSEAFAFVKLLLPNSNHSYIVSSCLKKLSIQNVPNMALR